MRAVLSDSARWLVSSVVLLFAVTVLTFVLAALAPGDAAKAVLSTQGSTGYTPQQYRQVRHELGLDQPLPAQYWHWLDHLLHGSLGSDMFSGQPVSQALQGRIGPSLSIILGTVLLTALAGIGLGIASAWRGGTTGRLLDGISLAGFALPSFWLALVLAELFAVKIRLFPAIGYTSPGTDAWAWLHSIALPIVTLSVGGVAFIAKQTRDAMSEALARDYITMLRARGLSPRRILLKHALRNAAIPVVTVVGLLFIGLLSGTVLIENVFGIPGLGQIAVSSTSTHDLPVIEGVAFYFTVGVVIVNLIVDVSYRLLNPKVRRA
jgi:peptide/nickel transport system permease protein